MKQNRELYNSLKELFNTDDIKAAIVTAVDKDLCTCDVTHDDLDIGGVQLQAIVKAGIKGVKHYPAIDSVVLLKRISDENYYVAMYSDLEETVMEAATKIYKLNANGHLIGAGNDTMLQAMILLIDAVSKTMVVYGNNPDYLSLQQAKVKLQNILQ